MGKLAGFRLGGGVLLALGLAQTQAQVADKVATTKPIEEVVVTAQKRESTLQETPIAITALTADQIERDQIRDFRDVAIHTPSMTFTQLQGYTQISMRGIGLDLTNLSAETSVALYEDGVYRGASFLQGMPDFDVERIEVLRGPQGTLYGRNATAGGRQHHHETADRDAGDERLGHGRQLRRAAG